VKVFPAIRLSVAPLREVPTTLVQIPLANYLQLLTIDNLLRLLTILRPFSISRIKTIHPFGVCKQRNAGFKELIPQGFAS
jgi:hypothetical protein